jgi:hypothetical protein
MAKDTVDEPGPAGCKNREEPSGESSGRALGRSPDDKALQRPPALGGNDGPVAPLLDEAEPL